MADLSDYEEVPDRIRKFFEKYPDGSLRGDVEYRDLPAAHLNGEPCLHIIYKALAYRTPGDKKPGLGMASEPVPGLTNFTKGSELMNAETSAWGRALVALGFVAKKVASANEVRSRQQGDTGEAPTQPQKTKIKGLLTKAGITTQVQKMGVFHTLLGRPLSSNEEFTEKITKREASMIIDKLLQGPVPTGESDVPSHTEGFQESLDPGADPTPFDEPQNDGPEHSGAGGPPTR